MEPLGLEVYKLRRFGVQTPGTQAVEKSEKSLRVHVITLTVYTLALKYSLYRYIGPKVYAKWVHGPLEKLQINKTCFRTDHETA